MDSVIEEMRLFLPANERSFSFLKKITHFCKYESKVTGLGLSGKEEGNLDRFLGHWSVEIQKFWKENCMQSIRPWSSFWFDRP